MTTGIEDTLIIPTPSDPTGDRNDGNGETGKRNNGKRRLIAVGVAMTLIIACGGAYGWHAWDMRRLTEAREACDTASRTFEQAKTRYGKTLKTADTAKTITVGQVADAKTVDALAEALKAAAPETVTCPADADRTGYETATGRINNAAAWYGEHEATVAKAVKAVGGSRDAKTLADAAKLLGDSKGRVADEGTRTALDKAIKAKDVQAVGEAVKAVDDSVKAKERADAEAKARADAAAQAQAQAQAQAVQQSQAQPRGYAGGSGSGDGYSGSGSYSGGGYSNGGSAASGAADGGGSSGSGGSGSGSGDRWISGCETTFDTGTGYIGPCVGGGDVWF